MTETSENVCTGCQHATSQHKTAKPVGHQYCQVYYCTCSNLRKDARVGANA